MRLYEAIDELVEKYQPAYITESDYRFIYDSQRPLLLELNVLRDKNKLQGDYLTWELEKYLSKIESFGTSLISEVSESLSASSSSFLNLFFSLSKIASFLMQLAPF